VARWNRSFCRRSPTADFRRSRSNSSSLLLEDEYDIKGQISRIAARGVSFSVDDFGKGYSNLGNLGKFDVTTLKIDQSFTFAMFDTAQDLALVEAIVRMAKALGLRIVAEGVETQRAASMLSLFGADYGQGYYWSKPLPMDDFVHYLGECPNAKAKIA
jgi:EAL domain-containing protein (putative c-di-GMP-specific phosphodiesterase class I)